MMTILKITPKRRLRDASLPVFSQTLHQDFTVIPDHRWHVQVRTPARKFPSDDFRDTDVTRSILIPSGFMVVMDCTDHLGERNEDGVGSHHTSVVDGNKEPLWKSFALFKDRAFASTTGVWCLLRRC